MFTFVRDHLGSVRAVVDLGGKTVCEESDYYTYGGKIPGCSATQLFDSRWGYSGKEDQSTIAGLPYLDYGARLYDTRTCRWLSPDPLAEKYRSLSPYAYCAGDPVNFVDPDGMDFQIKERRNTITIKVTIYTNEKSEPSLTQAADFWRNRTSDTYGGKTIKYCINIEKLSDEELNRYEQIDCYNTYEVDTKKTIEKARESGKNENASGISDSDTGETYVRDDYSITKPDSDSPSTTGAHEIGHILGMKHKEKGIMTKSQDDNRSDDVLQSNIDEMMNSGEGYRDFLSLFFRH